MARAAVFALYGQNIKLQGVNWDIFQNLYLKANHGVEEKSLSLGY
jgi:hypothetical protein